MSQLVQSAGLPRRSLFALGGAAVLFAAGCSTTAESAGGGTPESAGGSTTEEQAPSTVTVSHARGEIEVPINPQRAVVFDTVTIDNLIALGLKPAGVPEGVPLPKHLADQLGGVPAVGSLFEPDLEAVNALDPDLIVVGGRSSKAYDALAEIGVPVLDLTLPDGDPVAGLKERAAVVGTVWAKEADVKAKLGEIDSRIAELKGQAAKAGKGLIVMVSGGKLTGYGSGSRFGLIHDTLGLAEAAPGMKVEGHGEQISFEFIAQQNPDVIYVIDRDAAIGQEGAKAALQVLDTPLVMDTAAGKTGRIVELAGSNWYIVGNGLANLPEMLSQVAPGFSAA